MSTTPAEPGSDDGRRSLAVALRYAPGDSAPTVVAKGRGLIADEIIARAKEHGIFVHESPELVALLSQVDLDKYIPAQLYQAVAELLAWLYQIEHRPQMRETAPPEPSSSGLSSDNLG